MLESTTVWILLSILAAPQTITVELLLLESPEVIQAPWIGLSHNELTTQKNGEGKAYLTSGLKTARFPNHLMVQAAGSSPATDGPSENGLKLGGASSRAMPTAEGTSTVTVLLRDGSRIQPREISSDGQAITLMLDGDTRATIRAAQVQSIQLQPMTPAQQTQWEAILDSRLTADTLVLIRSAESVDKIEGVISGIGLDSVQFEFSGQKLNAPRAKLAGLRYFNPSVTLSQVNCIVNDIFGNSWNATQAIATEGSSDLEMLLACGEKVTMPLAQVHLLDFSRGSLIYVADLAPAGQEQKVAIELGIPIAGGKQLFGAQPILLPKTGGPSLRFVGSGWVTYRIPPDYKRLVGTVYMAPSGNRFTPCRAQVKLENEVLWEQQLSDLSQRLELSVAVEPDKRLRLEVVPQVNFPVGDVVMWEELRLQK